MKYGNKHRCRGWLRLLAQQGRGDSPQARNPGRINARRAHKFAHIKIPRKGIYGGVFIYQLLLPKPALPPQPKLSLTLLLLLRGVCVVALLLLLGSVFGFFGGFRLKYVVLKFVFIISFFFYVCFKTFRYRYF